ncbi:hypothetical protein [Phaffia rhodozyma]|uniref:Uncharacterized protein n=1 Tax=Phaffia rhodozyma TaxID=264483 RepID=A0A0F7SEK3_PHARH|nr:hypothetical protein [Phaffia rhodozyma]
MSSWFSYLTPSNTSDALSSRPGPADSPTVTRSPPATAPASDSFAYRNESSQAQPTQSTPEVDFQGRRNIYDLDSYYPKSGHRFVDPPVTDPDDPSAPPPSLSPSPAAAPGPNFPKVPETAFERVFKAKNPSEPLPEVLIKDPEQIKLDHQYINTQAKVNCSDIHAQLSECRMSWTKPYFTLECHELSTRADRCIRIQRELLPAMKFGEQDNTVAQDRLYARLADDEGRRLMAEEDERAKTGSQTSDA